MNRRLRALVPASLAVAVLALAGCGTDEPGADPATTPIPSATTGATPTAVATTSAENLDGITVEGAWGEEPTVEVPAPFGVDETMTKVLIEGAGPAVSADGFAEVHYRGINGRNGETFDDSWSREEAAQFQLNQVVPGFAEGLAGQRVGSRLIIAMPGTAGYDASGGNPQVGIEVGDTLVFVVDVTDAPLERADGATVTPPEGLPEVVFDGDEPRVTIPEGVAAPTELVVQPLIEGGGDRVQATDAITARYQAVLWSTGEVVENTYGGAAETQLLSALIPAWQQGLVDRPVGSRLLIVTPPELAYPEDPAARNPNPAAGETVVYVVDILHTQPGQ